MMCAFSHPTDAAALASAIDAQPTDQYPEWASQRCFTLDRPTAQAIADAIEASKMAPAPPQQIRLPRVLAAPAYTYRRAA